MFPALDGWLEAEGLTSTTLDSDAAQRWVDTLVTEGRVAKTVTNTWVAAPRAVFAWAKRRRKFNGQANPFQSLTVEKARQTITRETGKEFTEAEALTILQAALFVTVSPSSSFSAAKRWVPWLCAYTGARVGEITQLRVQDIQERACGPVLCITPEAGTVKNDRARTVPIHPHLVETGLLAYVEVRKAQVGDGPLFCHPKKRGAKGRGPAVQTAEKLATWVRSLGKSGHCPSLTDKGLQPNHAWRHTFKRRAARAGIEPRIRDGICGHAPRTVADAYELPTVEDMAVAIRKFPRWKVSPDQG